MEICLLNAAYKINSKIINNTLQVLTNATIAEQQCGFRKGRSCTDDVFIVKQITEKRREFNLETPMDFIDYENAFDCVDRNLEV